ncbi:phage tail protein [Vibrio cholerae]|uniref:phage tail-collar fiber domain-containing protein n=1 Tax=Vibrio cholerae TaxID=666 RepID=UPI0011D92E11|nr:phage tail protein [Vibrio cholerae]TXX57049.1 phage tail protein [Vibrio cholerae]GIB54315.1 putative tail fiber protein [Vibrio cholerae]
MSQTAIPLQFEKYLQNQISVGKAPDMNEMIFAYIPNLDPSQPIDRNQGLPAVSTWVHQQDIDQVGKLGDNALVYSVVIPGSVAAFTFNAIYLRDKNVPNSCGMVVHKATETKEAGMASTKSLMQQYTGAAQIAGITVDAQTWQIDYQARLLGIEEDMRLANLDNYGHTAFIQGFDVTQQADPAKYKVAPGVVYVGGLRAELKNEVIQTISAKPTGLYIDVVRTGTVLSKWQNIVTVRASATPLTDYVDQNQQQHYVARLAGINGNGSITDWRVKTDNADQEWSPFINYGIGQEVVRNGLRYIARAASGPDNGGAIEPNTVSSQLIWDPVLPTVFTSNDISSKWILLSDITFADFFSLEVVGGSKLTLAKNQFSCDVRFSFYEFGVGFEPPTVTVNTKTLGDDNPTFHTVKVSNSRVQLWMKINTNDPFPVTVLVKNRTRTSGSAAKAGILSVVDAAPTSATLVPYDTGYQFASIPIGMEVAFDTPPPTNDPRFRFVKLTYNDAYNTGLLTSQTLSGSAPELVSTAVISAAQSAINGQTIYLKNTMGVYAVPAVTQGIVAQNIPQPARYRIDSISPGVSLQTGPSISGFIITSAAYESQITGGLKPRSFGEVLYKRIY